jgi:hypothetical protein
MQRDNTATSRESTDQLDAKPVCTALTGLCVDNNAYFKKEVLVSAKNPTRAGSSFWDETS